MRTKLKKLTSVCLAVIMILSVLTIAPFTVGAAETDSESVGDTNTSGDFEYKVLDDGTAEITGYNGSATELEIPSTLDGYTVTSIGGYAFENCTSLTSITITDSVTEIGFGAFENCTSLTSVTISDSVTKIGGYAFKGCTSLTSITIPGSVTEIDSYTFGGCTSLDSITIPDTVTTIGWYAFSGCTSLTSITIPDSVTEIDCGVFEGCTSLKEAYIFGNIEELNYSTFHNCTSLEEVKLPDGLKTIYGVYIGKQYGSEELLGAFDNSTSLANINIPNSVTEVGKGAFKNTEWFNNQPDGVIYAGKVASEYKGEMPENTSIILRDGTKGIGTYAFSHYENKNLISVIIPKSVTNIGYSSLNSPYEYFTVYGYAGTIAETYANENNINFVQISEYTDTESQITVLTGTDAELKVAEIKDINEIEQVNLKLENEKVKSLFDISFVKNGATVQPDSTATVKIPCTNENSKVYRVETDGSLTDMNAVYDNGYMVFSTNHFSLYVLTSEKADVMLGDVDGDGKVSIDDVTDIQKYIANTMNFTEKQIALADVDKNGTVSIDDVTLIQKHLAGMAVIE